MNVTGLEHLLTHQLRLIADPARRSALAALLVAPRREVRTWQYGDEAFVCWVVVEHHGRDTALLYVEAPPPLAGQWCRVMLSDADLGRDDSWFNSLDDAFIESRLWEGAIPDDYEVS